MRCLTGGVSRAASSSRRRGPPFFLYRRGSGAGDGSGFAGRRAGARFAPRPWPRFSRPPFRFLDHGRARWRSRRHPCRRRAGARPSSHAPCSGNAALRLRRSHGSPGAPSRLGVALARLRRRRLSRSTRPQMLRRAAHARHAAAFNHFRILSRRDAAPPVAGLLQSGSRLLFPVELQGRAGTGTGNRVGIARASRCAPRLDSLGHLSAAARRRARLRSRRVRRPGVALARIRRWRLS